MIKVKNVSKVFTGKEDIHAVRNVNLDIADGEIYGIIGYSGAGKSTLIRIINQLEKQTSGTVEINNVNMSELSKKELMVQRQKIGMIFQHFNLLWSRTIEDNIALPLEIAGVSKEKQKEKVHHLIELVALREEKKLIQANYLVVRNSG